MRPALITTLLIATAFQLAGCQHEPDRQPYSLPEQPRTADWSGIRQSPTRIALKTLLTGHVTVPKAGMLDLPDGETGPTPKDEMEVAVFAHWLRHPQQGDFLIDTGLDDRFRNGGQGSYRGLLAPWIVRDSRQAPGQDIASQIHRNGIDLKGVFLTHIHGDHTAGLPALPRDAPVTVAAGEPLHSYPLIMYNDHFDNVETLRELDFGKAFSMPPFERVLDIFGDRSLLAIATPGHTEGNLSFLAHTTKGWVLLTGDASHTRWGFEHGVIPGWSTDSDAARNSLGRLMAFSEKNPEVRVIFGHQR